MDVISPHALGLSERSVLLVSGPGSGTTDTSRTPLFKRLHLMIVRYRWILVGGVVAGALLALFLTLFMTPQYASTVRLEINRDTDRVVDVGSVQRDTAIGDQEFYQTQYGLLATKALAERVARDLGLVDDTSFFKMFGAEAALTQKQLSPAQARYKRNEIAGRILLAHVNVAPVRGSRLVDVTATTPDAGLSQRIAQAWSDNFIQTTLEQRYNASSYARKFLEQRLAQLRGKLEESERAAASFAASQGIINLPSVGSDSGNGKPDRSLVSDDLTALNGALASATADRIQAQSRLIEARRPDATSEGLSNNAITALRQQRAEAAADYSKTMVQFEPNYPPAKAAAAQIKALDAAIAREEGRIRTQLQQDYQSSLQRENALRAKVSGLKYGLNDLRQRSIQYNIYQRDADTNRELYNSLLQRYKEIGVAGGVEKNNVSVVDPPQVTDTPVSPKLLVNLLLGMLAGGLGGAMLGGVLAQIDEGIRDPGDIEQKLGLPLLGAVPRLKGEDPVDALRDMRSRIVEAYLSVQTNLELSTSHGTPRSLAITSTGAREGKSTTTLALAQSLVRARRKVVLVDADMRAPSIHKLMGIDNETGVSNFLAGVDDLDRSLHATSSEGLTVLPSGPQPPNAGDLLTGDRFQKLLSELQQRFDHVIIDCPPVMGLADAPLIAASVEGLVYIVEAQSMQAGRARAALARLKAAHANVLGVIVTKVESAKATIDYGYDYNYGD